MKYIKTYESEDKIEVYDFVLCKSKFYVNDKKCIKCQNNVGRIMDIITGYPEKEYRVHYKKIGSVYFKESEIIAHSKNIEDIEILINANTYNL